MKVLPIPISKIQRTFRESDAWLRGFVGGRGSGKSKIGSIDISQRARPGEPWMAISPDNNMIRETTLPTFLETVNFTKQYISHVLAPTPRVKFRTRWGGCAELVFKGAEVPDKLRGPNKAGLWFDEASIISKDAFDIAIACCRYQGKMGPVLATFTPRGFAHWTFESFYDGVDEALIGTDGCSADGLEWFHNKAFRSRPDTFLVRCSTRDNPFAPPEYYSRIAQNYSTVLAMQELEGDFVEFSGMIFRREWFSKTVEIAPAESTRVRYWDKASSPDKGCYTVGLLMARDARGIYYIEDVVRGQWSAHERNEIMLQTARSDAYKYGHSVLTYVEQEGGGDGKTVADQLIVMMSEFPIYRDNVSAGGKWKTKGNVRLPGDAKIRRAQPFAAQCEAGNIRLVLGSSNGRWHRDYTDELCLTENTLITTLNGDKPIQDIQSGDKVWTRKGWRSVLGARKTGSNQEVFQIKTNCGAYLSGTANHPVWVHSKNFTKIEHIRANDELLLLSTDCDFTCTQNQTLLQSESIFQGISTSDIVNFIGTFMNRGLEQLAISLSTTRTGILSIIDQSIWSNLLDHSICQRIFQMAMCPGQQRPKRNYARFAIANSQQLPHAGLNRADLNAEGNFNLFVGMMSFMNEAASIVERTTNLRKESVGSVVSNAQGLRWAQPEGLKKNHVRTAKNFTNQNCRAKNTVLSPVVSVTSIGRADVYNLMVQGEHEYFANGILTHNCAFPEYAFADSVDASSGAYNVLQRVAPTYSNQTATRSTEVAAKSRYGHTVQHSEGDSISRWSDLPWNQDNFEGQTGY